MRIEKIRIVNLNSLYGINEIDLTAQEYVNDNIFLLWGDTGAGKTTVLDAITLALYGKTSRLDLISKSGNEIMSKGTRYCEAEVTFSLNGSQYRAHWSQELNRNGNLNPQQRELAKLNQSGGKDEILVSGINGMDAAIKDLIKLDYEQFTKTVLLGQGKFSEFLASDKNKRAEILEQLTNTQIYSKISVLAFNKEKESRLNLENAQKEVNNVEMLTPEKIEEYHIHLNNLETENKQLSREIESIDQAIKWLTDIENISKRIRDIEAEQERHQKENLGFEPLRKKLEAGKRASKIEHLYHNYMDSQRKLNRDKEELHNLQIQIPKQEQLLNDLNSSLNKLEMSLQNAQDERSSMKPVFDKVRQLNGNLKIKKSDYEKILDKLKVLSEEKSKIHSDLDQALKSAEDNQKHISDGEVYFREHAVDENLNSEMETIREKCRDLSKYQEILDKLRRELAAAEKICNESIRNSKQTESELQTKEQACDKIHRDVETAQNCVDAICNGETVELLNTQLKCAILERENQKLVAKLEEHRKELHDGKPCPLCGSLEHPYATGVPVNSDIDNRIHALETQIERIHSAEKKLEQLQKTERDLIAERDSIRHQLELNNKDVASNREKYDEKQKNIEENLQNQKLQMEEFNQRIEKYSVHAENDSEAQEICIKLERQQKLWNNGKIAIEKYKNGLEEAQKKVNENRIKLESMDKQIHGTQEDLNAKNLEITKDLQEIESIFGNRNVEEEEKKLNNAVLELENQRDKRRSEHTDARMVLERMNSEIKTRQSQLETDQSEFEKAQSGLIKGLESQGFESEDVFKNCILSEEEIGRLSDKSDALEKNGLDILSRLSETRTQLEKVKSQEVTDKSREELDSARDKMVVSQGESMKEFGRIQRKLQEQNEKQELRKELIDKVNIAQKEHARWKSLSTHIGSSTGDKFRTFVQGITFNILLNRANHYLKQLMDQRYTLVRSNEMDMSLEFMVLDNLTEDIRPSSNLSGGEKFCLCLALALGLSEMASDNVAIDSLFIDEGLGTLDDNTLGDALVMLKNLGGVKGERLVGLITHVSRARELIDAKITINKEGGGLSRLEGPGCTYSRYGSGVVRKPRKSRKKSAE